MVHRKTPQATRRLLRGQTVGIDATTLEANAALHSIVRWDTGMGYETFLRRLAASSGIATPTRAELACMDRKRPKAVPSLQPLLENADLAIERGHARAACAGFPLPLRQPFRYPFENRRHVPLHSGPAARHHFAVLG